MLQLVLANNTLVERWRDTGPILWVVAAGAALLWVAALIAMAVQSEPRRVPAGPPTFDPGGPEPPAVVNLVANDWELGRAAVPATLLDLAARRFASIDWIGERTLLRVRQHGPSDSELTKYERLVLDHVRSLSNETTDGFVPADALTTGPVATASRWWDQFEKAVVDDARARGLSRARWGSRARTILTVLAIVVGLTVFVASTTLTSDKKNDDPIGAAAGLGLMSAAALIAASSKLRGERDTVAGRAAAARWLGLRSMLSDDPTFATQPAAAVTIWDRMMSYGAALGVARAAVATLPFGAEDERRAWSPVGGRWRVVSIRYPRRLPPGYGRHPAIVALIGLVATVGGVSIAPGAVSVAHALLRQIDDLAKTHTVPVGVRVGVGVVLAAIVTIGALVALYGAGMLVAGVGDLLRRRRVVEGRVLRLRERGDDKHRFWHLAVDDGTRDRIRAWRVAHAPVHQGATVTARVSPWLCHVADLSMVREDRSADAVAVAVSPTASVAPAAAPPPLPDALAVSAAVGWPVSAAPTGLAHPLAIAGASRMFVTGDGGRIITAWISPAALEGVRRTPGVLAATVPGADAAYRPAIGGGLLAQVDGHVLMVGATLPTLTDEQRDNAVLAIARVVLAGAPPH